MSPQTNFSYYKAILLVLSYSYNLTVSLLSLYLRPVLVHRNVVESVGLVGKVVTWTLKISGIDGRNK
jgi:hypothetical protein